MLTRHTSNFDQCRLLSCALDIYNGRFEEPQIRHRREGFAFLLRVRQIRFGVRRCDYGQVATQGGLDFLVEVISTAISVQLTHEHGKI